MRQGAESLKSKLKSASEMGEKQRVIPISLVMANLRAIENSPAMKAGIIADFLDLQVSLLRLGVERWLQTHSL